MRNSAEPLSIQFGSKTKQRRLIGSDAPRKLQLRSGFERKVHLRLFFSSLFPGFNAALTNDFPRRFTQEHGMKNSKELNLPASFVKEP